MTTINNKKRNAKKNFNFKLKVLAVVFVSLIVLGVYAVREASDFIAERDAEIFNTGYETGRFDQLNEDAENTQVEIKANQAKAKQDLLNKLAQLESGNGEKRKILDTNNRYSLGLYHFQAKTVQDMYKRYYGKKITITEAVKIAQNDELATKLAHDAIFVRGEKFHWKISLCRLGELTKGCLSQKEINRLVMK